MPKTTHAEQLLALKKIEGQVRGVSRMIEEGQYCVDIITQLSSVAGALRSVQNSIFKKHIQNCVVDAIKSGSSAQKNEKITEIVDLVARLRG